MMLKRKRSFNDDMRSATVNQNTCPPFAKPNMSRSTASESMVSDAPFSRTMKRVRDLRPSEEKVHQHTLDLLFKGQREHTAQQKQQTLLEKPGLNGSTAYVTPSPSPAPEASRLQPQNPQADHAPQNQTAAMISQQQSLHNFWKLPPTVAVASGVASSRPIANITTEATACDDCGLAIGSTGSYNAGFGMDSSDHLSYACKACGKKVCDHCSISNMGENRHCLQCAGSGVSIAAKPCRPLRHFF